MTPGAWGTGVIEVLAYGLIWALPLLIASAAIFVSSRLNVSSITQMGLAYVAECLAIAATLWPALVASMALPVRLLEECGLTSACRLTVASIQRNVR